MWRSIVLVLVGSVAVGCEGSVQMDGDAGTAFEDGSVTADAADRADGSGPPADAGSLDAAPSDPDAGGEPEWFDPTLTRDSDTRARAVSYESQLWAARTDFVYQIESQYGERRLTDARARELTYSSGWGLAVYHVMDEVVALTHVMEVTPDPSHRAFYAQFAADTLDDIVPAIAEGRGTEGCTRSGSLFQCSPGYFRFLDAGHGAGAAGFVMNALFENPALRAIYQSDLEAWAAMLVPTLDRHISIADWSDTRFPHMPAKIAAGYLAVSKIIRESDPVRADRYLEAFTTIVRFMATSAEANGGWIGADISHARVSSAVLHLAYREQTRGTLPVVLTAAVLAAVGDGFEAARADRGAFEFVGSLVGHHGTLVRHSSDISALVDDTYTLDPARRGTHAWARPAETLGALAIGHVTLLTP